MRLFKAFVFSFVLACFCHNANAQVLNADQLERVDIDKVSDAEILAYYNRARQTGLTDDQIADVLKTRGMPNSEIQKLRLRLEKIKTTGVQTPTAATSSANSSTATRVVSDSLPVMGTKPPDRDTTIFGSELYTNAQLNFAPNLRIATPANYVIGPGDELLVDVYGYSEKNYRLPVSAEGTVYIQNVGPIKVAGLSVDEAAKKIRSQLAGTIYRAINSGQTKVSVSLGDIRSIQVTIIGQAMRPGTYTVPSLATAFNVLYLCGGPNDRGSYRNIELVRNGKLLATIDLYDFLHKGISRSNVLLHDQDVIRIPYTETRVTLSGAARRTGKFELKSGETAANLIDYAGGFADTAYRQEIKVNRISDSGQLVIDVAAKDFESFEPKPADVISIGAANTRYLNRVTVVGAVLRPGNYEFSTGMSLREVLQKAGGLLPEAFTQRATIIRKKEDLSLTAVTFSPESIIAGTQQITLQKEDEIRISSKFDLQDERTITIEGEVRQPGNYRFAEGITVRDIILQAGGFTDRADSTFVEVSRRLNQQNITSRDYQQSEVFNINLSKGLGDNGSINVLAANDLIIVRPGAKAESLRSVYVNGMVVSSGRYPLIYSTERVSDVLKRAGGFRGGADSAVVNIRRFVRKDLSEEARRNLLEKVLQIGRDSLLLNPELRNNFLSDFQFITVDLNKVREWPGGNEDLILEDGDLLDVPRASSLVKISGEIYNPTSLPYQEGKTSAKYYVKQSGGFTTDARKGRVFVLYPDGRTGTVNKFLFFKSYPKVTQRSEVFVPSKELEKRNRLSTGEWVAISSIMATLATIVISLTQ